jgi:hypothetical protein
MMRLLATSLLLVVVRTARRPLRLSMDSAWRPAKPATVVAVLAAIGVWRKGRRLGPGALATKNQRSRASS